MENEADMQQADQETSFKFCFIMRGVPGSGKSTVASKIKGENGIIHSTDDYFIDANGEYQFDKTLLAKNHEK